MARRLFLLALSLYMSIFTIAHGEAKAYILMDFESGRVLGEKNADQRLAIASTTKIMTCLLALENCLLTESVTASENASGVPGTSIYLAEGETLSMEDMLYGLMLRSGNDAAVAIAEHISGSASSFAELMNKRAQELNANAYFTTPNGLDEGGNGASARGIVRIACEALKHEQFRKIVSTKKRTIPWADHKYERVLTNKNKLLSDYEGAIGIKTGFTKKAGRCLVFAAEREGMTVVGCVLNCPDWFDESERLMNDAFQTFKVSVFHGKGETVRKIKVGGRDIEIAADRDVKAPVREGENVKTEIRMLDLSLPVFEGQKAGEILLIADGEELAAFDLICKNTETKPSFSSALKHVISLWTVQ
ncbi:MAG: D-alanyl-D-alanine carboxypeptidase [Clostridia bacterium]|nr:D-alanyl-D-alanine carboxypeptidase [Clostridia bacterium]